MDVLEVATTKADKLTSLTISYVFEGELLGTLNLTGGKAEYGPAMMKAFHTFLEGMGYVFDTSALLW